MHRCRPADNATLTQPTEPPCCSGTESTAPPATPSRWTPRTGFVSPDDLHHQGDRPSWCPTTRRPDVDYYWRVRADAAPTASPPTYSDARSPTRSHPIATPDDHRPDQRRGRHRRRAGLEPGRRARSTTSSRSTTTSTSAAPTTAQVPDARSTAPGSRRRRPSATTSTTGGCGRVDLDDNPTEWVAAQPRRPLRLRPGVARHARSSSTPATGPGTPVRRRRPLLRVDARRRTPRNYELWLSTDPNFTDALDPHRRYVHGRRHDVHARRARPVDAVHASGPRASSTTGRSGRWTGPSRPPACRASSPRPSRSSTTTRSGHPVTDARADGATVDVPTPRLGAGARAPRSTRSTLLKNTGASVFSKETLLDVVHARSSVEALDPADGPFTLARSRALDDGGSRPLAYAGAHRSPARRPPRTRLDAARAVRAARRPTTPPTCSGARSPAPTTTGSTSPTQRDRQPGTPPRRAPILVGQACSYPAATDTSVQRSWRRAVTTRTSRPTTAPGSRIADGWDLGRVGTFAIDPLQAVHGQRLALTGSALDAANACTKTLADGDEICTGLPPPRCSTGPP